MQDEDNAAFNPEGTQTKAQKIMATLPGTKHMQTYTGDTLQYTEYTPDTLQTDIDKGKLKPEDLIPLYCEAQPISGSQSAAVAALASRVTAVPTQSIQPPQRKGDGLDTIQTLYGHGQGGSSQVVGRPGQFSGKYPKLPESPRGGTRRKRNRSNNAMTKKYSKK